MAEQEFWKNASHVRKDLYDVDAVADFWNWLTPFANVVLGSNTAGGMFPDQPGFFYRYFRILGLMRLRQVRVQKVPLHITPKDMSVELVCWVHQQGTSPHSTLVHMFCCTCPLVGCVQTVH